MRLLRHNSTLKDHEWKVDGYKSASHKSYCTSGEVTSKILESKAPHGDLYQYRRRACWGQSVITQARILTLYRINESRPASHPSPQVNSQKWVLFNKRELVPWWRWCCHASKACSVAVRLTWRSDALSEENPRESSSTMRGSSAKSKVRSLRKTNAVDSIGDESTGSSISRPLVSATSVHLVVRTLVRTIALIRYLEFRSFVRLPHTSWA